MTSRIILAAAVLGGCASGSSRHVSPPAPPAETEAVGVLVMAHRGSSEWIETVLDAVAPLAHDVPTVVAFGMADPKTLA